MDLSGLNHQLIRTFKVYQEILNRILPILIYSKSMPTVCSKDIAKLDRTSQDPPGFVKTSYGPSGTNHLVLKRQSVPRHKCK